MVGLGTDILLPPGPFGERDEEQVFIQRVIPETDRLFVRLSSNGRRYVQRLRMQHAHVHTHTYLYTL